MWTPGSSLRIAALAARDLCLIQEGERSEGWCKASTCRTHSSGGFPCELGVLVPGTGHP